MARPRSTLPPQGEIIELIDYNPVTGEAFWKIREEHHFSRYKDYLAWNNKNAGNPILNKSNFGYIRVSIKGRRYLLHRVIWRMIYDEEPHEIDHINHNRSDNRLENLRAATRAQNSANSSLSSRNLSGFKGASYSKKLKKWRARIGTTHLGVYSSPEEAHEAYCKAAKELHGTFACTE